MKTIMLLLSFRSPDYCSSAFTTLFTNKSIIKDEPLANRIPQEKHTFISVVIFQTSESTLHSHRIQTPEHLVATQMSLPDVPAWVLLDSRIDEY